MKLAEITPSVLPDRWRVTSKATGQHVIAEGKIAMDAYHAAKLRDESGVLLHFSQVRVEPAEAR